MKENILEEKLKILEINKESVSRIKDMIYKPFDENESHVKDFKENQIINLDKLAGLNRWDANQFKDWIDVLNSLHKMRNFDIYTKSTFENVIMNPLPNNIPQVISFNEEFYIDGEGKHRLTIAKCLGIKQAKVDIKYI